MSARKRATIVPRGTKVRMYDGGPFHGQCGIVLRSNQYPNWNWDTVTVRLEYGHVYQTTPYGVTVIR